jgi:hypothetical protein
MELRRCRLHFGGTNLGLAAPAEWSELWRFLEAYLRPLFEFEDLPANVRPDLIVGPLLRLEPPPPQAEAVAVDHSGGFLRCDGLRWSQRGVTKVWLSPFAVEVGFDPACGRIELRGPREAMAVPALRVIEDRMTWALERAGGVFLHASAVVADGRAILAVGRKGAGKTSCLVRLLKHFDVANMANDTVALFVDGDDVVARGWPSFFKAAAATVADHEELAHAFPPVHSPLLRDSAALWRVYEKIALYPSEAAECFNRPVTAQARLGTILLPNFSRVGPTRLEPVARSVGAAAASGELQGSQNPNHPDWLGQGMASRAKLEVNLEILLAAAADLRVLQLDWAPALEDLLGDVPELVSRRLSHLRAAKPLGRRDTWPPLPHRPSESAS